MTLQHFDWNGRGKVAAVRVGKEEEVVVVKTQDEQNLKRVLTMWAEQINTHIQTRNLCSIIFTQIPHFVCKEPRN